MPWLPSQHCDDSRWTTPLQVMQARHCRISCSFCRWEIRWLLPGSCIIHSLLHLWYAPVWGTCVAEGQIRNSEWVVAQTWSTSWQPARPCST